MELEGVTAAVTGGASGLGAATAAALAERGAKVFVLDLPGARDQVDAERATFVECDVTREAQVEAAIAQAAAGGDLRVCVNCAGIGWAERTLARDGPAALEPFRKVIEVNLIGTFNVIRARGRRDGGAPSRRDGERGVIVNTASVAAFDGQIGQAAYSASKGGRRRHDAPDRARSRALGDPRASRSRRASSTRRCSRGCPSRSAPPSARRCPSRARLGRPDEYAALAVHIVENQMLNGEVIRLDGAIRMAPK